MSRAAEDAVRFQLRLLRRAASIAAEGRITYLAVFRLYAKTDRPSAAGAVALITGGGRGIGRLLARPAIEGPKDPSSLVNLGDLAATDGPQPGEAAGPDVAAPHSEPEYVVLHCHDLVAGEVEGSGDQHPASSGLTVRWVAPGHRRARAARHTSARRPRR